MSPLLCALMALLLPAQAEKTIQLRLQQEYGRAVFRDCRLDIGVYEAAGRASMRCLRNHPQATELLRGRALTGEEVARLRGLVRESKLMTGGYIGTDTTASDGVFETLKVLDGTATAGVLVTSGNPSFVTGPRRQLLDWLRALLSELQKSAR